MDDWPSLRSCILEGIPNDIPSHPGIDSNIVHAPARRQVLTNDEKRLALRNALRYFPHNHHAQLAPEFADELVVFAVA